MTVTITPNNVRNHVSKVILDLALSSKLAGAVNCVSTPHDFATNPPSPCRLPAHAGGRGAAVGLHSEFVCPSDRSAWLGKNVRRLSWLSAAAGPAETATDSDRGTDRAGAARPQAELVQLWNRHNKYSQTPCS